DYINRKKNKDLEKSEEIIIARSAIEKSAVTVAVADRNENDLIAKETEEELTIAEKTIIALENTLNEKTVIASKASKASSLTS
ncbi:1016_t:CDS:1, partial [Funneliformis mosseae]